MNRTLLLSTFFLTTFVVFTVMMTLLVSSPAVVYDDTSVSYVSRKREESLAKVHAACRRLRLSDYKITGPTRVTHDAIYFDDARQYMYCAVPKVACTNWKRVLLTMSGLEFDTFNSTGTLEHLPQRQMHARSFTDRLLKRIVHFSWPQLKLRLDSYYKFMFVREPFERLLSAYLDKVVRNPIPVFRKKFIRTGPVKFPDFVRIVINAFRRGRTLDRHWRPQHELCQPCYFAYTFIGHYETLSDDADQVLTRLNSVRYPNVTAAVVVDRFPSTDDRKYEHRRTRDLMDEYYSQIPDDHKKQLFSLYAKDYEIFGFKRPYLI